MSDELSDLSERAGQVCDLYARTFGINADGSFYLGKLTEELGEVASAWLKLAGKSRGADTAPEQLRADLTDELADLFGFLLAFARWQGIDLAAAFEAKWGRHLQENAAG